VTSIFALLYRVAAVNHFSFSLYWYVPSIFLFVSLLFASYFSLYWYVLATRFQYRSGATSSRKYMKLKMERFRMEKTSFVKQ